MSTQQLPLRLVPPRPASPARAHIDRAGIIARQIPSIRHKAGKKYAVRQLLAELRKALTVGHRG